MNILGMGFLEMLVVFFIAFIVLGPERMVDMSRKAGRLVGDLRRMNSGLRETLTADESEQEPESRTGKAGDDDEQGEDADERVREAPVDFRAWRASRLHVSPDAGEDEGGEQTDGSGGGPNGETR